MYSLCEDKFILFNLWQKSVQILGQTNMPCNGVEGCWLVMHTVTVINTMEFNTIPLIYFPTFYAVAGWISLKQTYTKFLLPHTELSIILADKCPGIQKSNKNSKASRYLRDTNFNFGHTNSNHSLFSLAKMVFLANAKQPLLGPWSRPLTVPAPGKLWQYKENIFAL